MLISEAGVCGLGGSKHPTGGSSPRPCAVQMRHQSAPVSMRGTHRGNWHAAARAAGCLTSGNCCAMPAAAQLLQLTGPSCPRPSRRRPSSACSTCSRSSTAAAAPASPACWPAPASSAAVVTPAAALPCLAACCRRQNASWTPPFDAHMPCYPYIAFAAVPGWAVARRGRGPAACPAPPAAPPTLAVVLPPPSTRRYTRHPKPLVSNFSPTLSAACLPPAFPRFIAQPHLVAARHHIHLDSRFIHIFAGKPTTDDATRQDKPGVTHDCPPSFPKVSPLRPMAAARQCWVSTCMCSAARGANMLDARAMVVGGKGPPVSCCAKLRRWLDGVRARRVHVAAPIPGPLTLF